MELIQLLFCRFGNHHRDKHRSRYDGTRFRSTCTGCQQPMVRHPDGWKLATRDEMPTAIGVQAIGNGARSGVTKPRRAATENSNSRL